MQYQKPNLEIIVFDESTIFTNLGVSSGDNFNITDTGDAWIDAGVQ